MSDLKRRKISHEDSAPVAKKRRSEADTDITTASRPAQDVAEEEIAVGTNRDEETKKVETFAGLGVVDALCEACTALDFKTPTAIQA
ncbi:ribosomal RNA processing protein, partial [Teratosphaeriaceae sp. CCFEE 6253]